MNPYTFRPYRAEDIPFIQSSWGFSYYDGKDHHRRISSTVFHKYHRPLRDRFFSREGTSVTICCSSENADHILGWAATETPSDGNGTILHFIYVKQAFKGEGIGAELIKMTLTEPPIFFTHLTYQGKSILSKKNLDYQYMPHLT